MSEVKTNEAEAKKVYYIPCEMTREDAAFMGIDPKLVRPLIIDGKLTWGIETATEDRGLYEACVLTAKASQKREERKNRCLILRASGRGMKRCMGDCSRCECEEKETDLSLDELDIDALNLTDGQDAALSLMQSEFWKDLQTCLDAMPTYDRRIAYAILNKTPDRVMMRRLHFEKQSSYSYQKMRVRKILREAMEAWL